MSNLSAVFAIFFVCLSICGKAHANQALSQSENCEVLLTESAIRQERIFSLVRLPEHGAYAAEKTKLAQAQKLTRGEPNVIIAIIDTGVDDRHPQLRSSLWPDFAEANFANPGNPPNDQDGHGTMVAGIIHSVAPEVTLMPLKISDTNRNNNKVVLPEAVRYAIRHGASIINISWGNQTTPSNFVEQLEGWSKIYDESRKADALIVWSAGNNDLNINRRQRLPKDSENWGRSWPDGQPWPRLTSYLPRDSQLMVASSDANDEKAQHSNYGRDAVDVFAPGVDLATTYPGGKYIAANGTSFAAAYVSGAAALARSLHPDWRASKVRKAILSTADKRVRLSSLSRSGGRLNIYKALLVNP